MVEGNYHRILGDLRKPQSENWIDFALPGLGAHRLASSVRFEHKIWPKFNAQ